jgi:hypothetical protein
MNPFLTYLAPWPDAGSTVVQKHTLIREISGISVKKTTFLCKTNPIRQGRICSIPLYNKVLYKIYIFVESQFKPNSKPNEPKLITFWASWAIFSGISQLVQLPPFSADKTTYPSLRKRRENNPLLQAAGLNLRD